MATSRKLLRSSWSARLTAHALIALSIGCAGSSPVIPTDDKRRPDGVAVDPLESPPAAVDVAEASSGVVSLRAPLGVDAARATVSAFFEAVGNEDGEALMKLLSMDAVWVNPTSRAREPAYSIFSRRFGRLDYGAVAGVKFWGDEHVLEGEDAVRAWAQLVPAAAPPGAGVAQPAAASSPLFLDTLDQGDVLVRAPINITRGSGAASLFGAEVALVLRRDEDRYVIRRLAEDFVLQP